MASAESTITDLFNQTADSDEQSYYESNNDDILDLDIALFNIGCGIVIPHDETLRSRLV